MDASSINGSPVESLADEHLARWIQLEPCEAAIDGLAGSETELTDYSPIGDEARRDQLRHTLAALAALTPTDGDEVTAALLRERLGVTLAQYEAGDRLGEVGELNGQLGAIRGTFDNLPTETGDDVDRIRIRLGKVPRAIQQLREGIAARFDAGRAAPIRQIGLTIEQCATWAGAPGSGGAFAELGGLRPDLVSAAVAAGEAVREFGMWLRSDIAPLAREADAVGADHYARAVPVYLGTAIDPHEAYAWGWDEVHRLTAEMRTTIDAIVPGASLVEIREHLDERHSVIGAHRWLGWLQDLTDRTIDDINGRYFDIDPAIVRCEAMLPQDGVGAAPYYTAPSEDLRICGRTWYPPLDRETFPTWDMVSTVYHESVPGHHLQIGRVKVMADQLGRYRRNLFISGHGEGWALYAERLMDEIGSYADDPAGRLSFLGGQILRAYRIVIDIGSHLELPIPPGEEHGGAAWTAEIAKAMLVERCGESAEFATSEIDRYLAWPAQAISYKLGEREWLAARADAQQRAGGSFDLKAWHEAALDLGAIGLGQLRTELAR